MIFREIQELLYYHSKHGKHFAEHDCRNVFEKTIKDLNFLGLGSLKGKEVLDLGCGQRFPFALQCVGAGANVTALDLDYAKPDILPLAFLQTVKYNGLKRACKSLLRKLLFDGTYYDSLERVTGKPLRDCRSRINFIVADPHAESYPLPSNSFDLIASNAVIEHVNNVSRFAAEICRLLRMGGIFMASFITFIRFPAGITWNGHFRMSNHLKRFRRGITCERIGFQAGRRLIVYCLKNMKRLFQNIWRSCFLKEEISIMTLVVWKGSDF